MSQSADLCATDRTSELSVVRSDEGGLSRLGRMLLPGHSWEILAQSDERVLLQQTVEGLHHLVIIDVSNLEETGSPELILERVLGGAWFAARAAVVLGDQVFVATRTGGLMQLE